MAENNKSYEMREIHNTIWKIADNLRGAVDGWEFKTYVLGTLFYKYLSEYLCSCINDEQHALGDVDFDYAKMADDEADMAKDSCINDFGYFMYPSQLFENVVINARSNDNLNVDLANIFNDIEQSTIGTKSEKAFKGLFSDLDTNSPKLGDTVAEKNKTLIALLEGINSMKLGKHQDNSVDAFGDAYEFLMGMYASNAGKSGGEYYTPQEVSELLVKLAVGDKKEISQQPRPIL